MKCQIAYSIVIQTYRKDRWIEVKKSETGYQVPKKGYQNNLYEQVTEEDLKKLQKELKARELPRNNQVWFKAKKAK